MTTSQRSSEVYVVDIPEVKNVTSEFRYNFYVNDEGVTENTAVSSEVQLYDANDAESYFKYVSDRAPRFNIIKFSPTTIAEPSRTFNFDWFRKFSFRPVEGGVIAANLDKIIEEDHFSSNGYTAVQFHDGDISTKVKELVSASILQHLYVEGYDDDISEYRKTSLLSSHTPNNISARNLGQATSQTANPGMLSFTRGPTQSGRQSVVTDEFFDVCQSVDVHTQINNKVLYDIVDASIKSPTTSATTDMVNLHKSSHVMQKQSIAMARLSSFEKFDLLHIDSSPLTIATQKKSGADVIGYIVDKIEVLSDGNVRFCDPIIVENAHMGCAVDYSVRYGATYMYAVRTIVRTTVAAVDEESDELMQVTILMSSKPSNRTFVVCEENCPPAPPADLTFRWDYGYQRDNTDEGTGRLIVTWTFPSNAQRDIKKFQVFRRRTIDEPFLLIKEYDFNDSQSPLPRRELPGAGVSEKLTSPRTWYFDADFTRNSQYIYATACIDAHELSSGYSDQFALSFDVYKNRLVKTLVSHSGAPKSYPNMYLEGDTFIDAIVDEGHDRVRLYFNPEFFEYARGDGKQVAAFETVQTGGEYRLQFINTSAQDTETVTVEINDTRPEVIKQLSLTSPGLSAGKLSKALRTSR